jgi:hypothetical protein
MDIDPRDPFGDGMRKLNLLNEKIYGPRKIPGLRKWLITTIYYLFMKRRAYIPSVTEDFVRDVQQQIRLFLTYSPESPIFPFVNAIADAIADEKAGRITEKEYDTMVNNLVKESITAGAGAGAVINAAVAAGIDIAAKSADAGPAGAHADADGGGIRRVRSLRHKNKISRRVKKTRRTRRTRRMRRMRRIRRNIKSRNR